MENNQQQLRQNRFVEFLLLVFFSFMTDFAINLTFGFKLRLPYYLITLAIAVLVASLIMLIRYNKLRLVFEIWHILTVFAFLIINTCLFAYKNDMFALGMIYDISDGAQMGVKYRVLIAFPAIFWVIWIALALATMTGLVFLTRGKSEKSPSIRRLSFLGVVVAVLVLTISPLLLTKRDRATYATPQDKPVFIRTFGMKTFQYKDLLATAQNFVLSPAEKRAARRRLASLDLAAAKPQSSEFGSLAGSSVVMIMMETVEEYAVDPILTPTLHRLLHEKYSFPYCYGVAKTNYTYDAEFKALTSMMYYRSDNFMHTKAKNTYTNALPSLLKAEGYQTRAFHANSGTYFNRHKMYPQLGITEFYDLKQMEALTGPFTPYDFWPLESEMIAKMGDLIVPAEGKFFSHIVTMTTHGAFEKQRAEFAPYYEKIATDGRFKDHEIEFINLLAAQMDFDLALERLLLALERQGRADDTLLVLYSDHKNYSSLDITYKYSDLSGKIETVLDYDLIPFGIYHPALTEKVFTNRISQYDIMPTVADLLGLPLPAALYYGTSALALAEGVGEEQPIIFGYSTFLTADLAVHEGKILKHNPAWDKSRAEREALAVRKMVRATITRFDDFFRTDYFKELRR